MKIMYSEHKPILLPILFLFSFLEVNSTIISEGFDFFNPFYYKDVYQNLIRQKKLKKCSILEGPNCFFIEGKNKAVINNELKNIFSENNKKLPTNPKAILNRLKENIEFITKEKEADQLEDVSRMLFDTSFKASFYLTFDSYDEMTKFGDTYAPEVIDVKYNIGRLTLTFLGKLRLSQKNAKYFEDPTPRSVKDDGPRRTYARVGSEKIFIKFNSPTSITSLYIKKNNLYSNDNNFILYGYKRNKKKIITNVQNVPNNRWIKIAGDDKEYDYIELLRGFDYDNFIFQTTLQAENYLELDKYNKKFSSSVNTKLNKDIQRLMDQFQKDVGPGIGIKINIQYNYNIPQLLQNQIEQEEEAFDIPKELMEELENRENNNGDDKK